MVDLKTAVESGRRWRHPRLGGKWWGPGFSETSMGAYTALSSDFEVEPEYLKCNTPAPYRELRCPLSAGHQGQHTARWNQDNMREWTLLDDGSGWLHDHKENHRCDPTRQHRFVRVHEADVCEMLQKGDSAK